MQLPSHPVERERNRCAFEERCNQRIEKCKQEQPLVTKEEDGRYLRCFNAGVNYAK